MATLRGRVWSFFTCMILACTTVQAFNLDVDPSTVKVFESLNVKQYFGYSVALHNSSGLPWVLVGAPLANVSGNLLNYGTVYKCSHNNRRCEEVVVDHDAETSSEVKTGQWLGAVVHSQDKKVVICAPRYHTIRPGFRYPIGRCFLLEDSLRRISKTLELSREVLNSETQYAQLGLSAQYADNADDVIMGTVGVSLSKGGMASYSNSYQQYVFSTRDQLNQGDYMGYAVAGGSFSGERSVEFVGGAPRAENTKGKVLIYSLDPTVNRLLVSSTLQQPKELGIGSYFGSSLCVVDLNADGYQDILVGAPRFTEAIDEGRAFVYINNKRGVLNPSDTVLKGDNQPGAQFGSAIASIGDINLDGFQDVAIGAPYEDDGAGTGAVYIYHGTSEGIEQNYRQKILGSAVEKGLQMFGHSISGDVDVDSNKYPDLAVGAYGSEKVFLLRSRRIVDVTSELTLSSYRVVLESNSSSELCQNPSTGQYSKCIKATIKLKYSDPTRPADSDLRIDYKLELDRQSELESLRRMYFLDSKDMPVFVTKGNHTFARQNQAASLPELTVFIKEEEQIADVISELTFDLEISLAGGSSCVDGLCPVHNSYKPSTSRAVALFQKKCREDVCRLDLAVSGSIKYEGDYTELRIGLVNEMTVQLTVENLEQDTAYDAKVILTYPSSLGYTGVKSDERLSCDKSGDGNGNGTSALTCTLVSPANPMDGLSERRFVVKFSTQKVKSAFKITVETSSGVVQDTNDKNNKAEFPVDVKFEADLEMRGSSNPDQVVYSEEEAKETKLIQKDIGPKIVQTLQIRNNGPSPVDGSEVKISIPVSYGTAPDDYLLYLLNVELTAGTCKDAPVNPKDIPEEKDNSTKPENDNGRRKRRDVESGKLNCRRASCKTFECSLGLLDVGSTVEIQITARLWQSTLVKHKVGVVDLETEARVKVPERFSQSNEDNDQVLITTRANPAKQEIVGKSTPWYVIFASVLGGILLLVAAAALLYKFGFFKRKRYGQEISNPQNEEE